MTPQFLVYDPIQIFFHISFWIKSYMFFVMKFSNLFNLDILQNLIHLYRIIKSGHSGSSNGSEIPVKFWISPDNALAYNPLTSRSMHFSTGHFMKTVFAPQVSLKFFSQVFIGIDRRHNCYHIVP